MSDKHLCLSCGSTDVSVFYEVQNVPVNSCLLLSTEREALDFPRGDIVLGFCKLCGFISNLAFDPLKVIYSSAYEDQQSFSSTFNKFAQDLAKRLIDKYQLHNKTILEIGCGKGDFLALLCELGPNSGVGVDPAHIKGRVLSKASDRLEFIADYYSQRYGNYQADFVCCRHTLEHIPNVFEFVSEIRKSIGNRLDTAVFFEIPDITRVLREQAFWDIYYEHCSYFSVGSIARLFRQCSFEVTDLYRDFDDQYLIIEARPTLQLSNKINVLEENVTKMTSDVQYFASHCWEKIAHWRDHVKRSNISGKRVIVWGSGSKCVAFLTTLGIKDEVEYIVDINPFRQGKFMPGVGKEIMSPQFLNECKPDLTIVMNPVYCQEIKRMLLDMNINTEVIAF
jgi:SAM-dependent methyltransferase